MKQGLQCSIHGIKYVGPSIYNLAETGAIERAASWTVVAVQFIYLWDLWN